MCGILVVVSKNRERLDGASCRLALSRMIKRGPDACVDYVWKDHVFMGQTILSLVGDIRPDSKEHLFSRSGNTFIAFNGEIYNYREIAKRTFPTDDWSNSAACSDTEILVNLLERTAPAEINDRLDGMYAYAALNTETGQLLLSRDIQGEKSLYIYEDADRVIVSSEIGSILSLRPNCSLDEQVLRDYFHTRHFMQFERTAYQGVRQLQPGCTETLDLERMVWLKPEGNGLSELIDPALMERNARRSTDDLADELDSILERCVVEMLPRRARYASVLSGGIDSSLISHYLLKRGAPEFLVAVNHVGKDRISNDLRAFSDLVGRDIHVLRVDQAAYSAAISPCQQTCGSPILSHSFVPQSLQSAHVHSLNCRVLFGGDGADEIFGGYDCYLKTVGSKRRFSPSPYGGYQESEVCFEGDAPQVLQRELEGAWSHALEAYRHVEDPEERASQAVLFCDAAYQLPSVTLHGGDLMTSMWAVELRSVFLRKEVVRFALNLPLRAKVDRSLGVDPRLRTKVLLKRLFCRHFSKELIQEKQGFAGFPNESAFYLGSPKQYFLCDRLGVTPEIIESGQLSKAALWKLTNTEYFLRNQPVKASLEFDVISDPSLGDGALSVSRVN